LAVGGEEGEEGEEWEGEGKPVMEVAV